MKIKLALITLILCSLMFTGCTKKANNGTNTTPAPTQATTSITPSITTAPAATTVASTAPGADVVTTASIVNTQDAFIKAISKDGTWIIAILNDMAINQDLVVEGEFKNGKKDDAGKDIIQRKLAFYSQDQNRNITARYVLTAPKMTIRSPQASIQHGTFKGDLYVDVDNFQLIDATVDGNVYFTKKAYQDSFKMDATSKITGTQTVR